MRRKILKNLFSPNFAGKPGGIRGALGGSGRQREVVEGFWGDFQGASKGSGGEKGKNMYQLKVIVPDKFQSLGFHYFLFPVKKYFQIDSNVFTLALPWSPFSSPPGADA